MSNKIVNKKIENKDGNVEMVRENTMREMENKNIKDKEINKMIKYGDLREWDVSEGLVMNYEKVDDKYAIENDITMDEKIEIINSIVDLPISYVLDLIKKFVEDYEAGIVKKAPRTSYFNIVNTNSLKAWVKRNNIERVLYYDGCLGYLGVKTNICNFLNDDWRRTSTPESFVDEVFHSLLNILKEKEEKYYFENSEENAYIGKVCDLICKYKKWSHLSGKSFYIEEKKDSQSMKNSIFICENHHNRRALSIEEIESLERSLLSIEEEYQKSSDRIKKLKKELEKEEAKKDSLVNNAVETFMNNIKFETDVA